MMPHSVQQTCFHYIRLDLLLIHVALHDSLTSIVPIPLDDVAEQQKRR
jgi:hypothetical protein